VDSASTPSVVPAKAGTQRLSQKKQMTLVIPIAAAINHLLVRQPSLQATLAAHAGKTACVATGFFDLRLRVAADGLLEAGDAETASVTNVTIRVKPADLPQILANRERAFSYVKIEGDADFANTISQIANKLRWEAEENLAPLVGDIAAVRIVQSAQASLATLQSTGKKLVENMAEYLLEENPTLLHRQAADEFASEVASLRDDAERLAKRIQLLERA
jgi:ubiquinone biosynthesis protein UbiJ